jgi:non-specific serine/threonine protein kinase
LATSREGLGIAGELAYRVPSLPIPDLKNLPPFENLSQYEAVRLFIERAVLSQLTFAVTNRNAPAVAQICHRLDGIPLAIELAAARVKALSVEEIAARLDDRFRLLTGGSRTALPRQQTLRATIDWSYNLLSEPERILFRRLSVFAGGWTIEAAEAICGGDGVESHEVMDLLTQLVNKSLVVMEEQEGETRYRLPETVRQYARDKLLESGEAALLRGRHLEWFLGLVEQGEPGIWGPDQAAWLERLEVEHDNLRAALEWSKAEENAEKGLRLAGALMRFWFIHSHFSEGRGWLEGMLTEGSGAPASVRAKALNAAGGLAWGQADYERTKALCEESLALFRAVGDKRGIAESLRLLGTTVRLQGDYERAVALGEESLALYRELKDKWGVSWSLLDLGIVAIEQGSYGRAAVLLEESLSLRREMKDRWGSSVALINLGRVALNRGNYDRARVIFEENLALYREMRDKRGIAFALHYLGYVVLRQGDYERATALFEESLFLAREVGSKDRIALCLEGLAEVAEAKGQQERAARLFGAVEALSEAIGFAMPSFIRVDYDRSVAAVRAGLGEEAFAKAWEEGRKMTVEEAVQLAVSREQ